MQIYCKDIGGKYRGVKQATHNTIEGATPDKKADIIRRRITALWLEFRRNLAEAIYCDRGGKG